MDEGVGVGKRVLEGIGKDKGRAGGWIEELVGRR